MFKNSTLTSIPERNENEDECSEKWVPKKKHEVLKAKYKCLKKLFQIYDANVVGFLPDPTPEITNEPTRRRKKRSRRTKSDACAGTTEFSNGDITVIASDEKTASVVTDNTSRNESKTEITKPETEVSVSDSHSQAKFVFTDNEKYADMVYLDPREYNPYGYGNRMRKLQCAVNERRKLTRFQCFVQRLLGIRREQYELCERYASSDTYPYRKRRRGLRFRRLRRKKIKSETDIKDLRNPEIMSYIQSVQRSCLMDDTPRQCPIIGCKMVSYGIINYNDHLNLTHFRDKKYICHYCHEGFEKEVDKCLHENEHIGLNRMIPLLPTTLSNSTQSSKIASITQTEADAKIPQDKLMKIVSFFDKIVKNDDFSNEKNSDVITNSGSECDCNKRMVSFADMKGKKDSVRFSTKYNPANMACPYCGECFVTRRQLSFHVDIEHRMHNRFSKFHSCAGIINRSKRIDLISDDGEINIQSQKSSSDTRSISEDISINKSVISMSCDPSTNIVYCQSKKPTVMESFVRKVRSYKWEPETKIIRV